MAALPRLRTTLAILLAGVLAVPLCLGGLPGPAAADPKPTLAQVQRQVHDLNRQAEQATERYNTARVHLAETKRRLDAVRGKFDRQQERFASMQTLVGRIAAASYKSGSVDPSFALLLSTDPTTFLRQAAELTQLNRRQGTMLREMATERLRLQQDRKAVAQQREKAAALTADLAAEKSTVEGRLAQASLLLESLTAAQQARLDAANQTVQDRARDARSGAARASRDSREGTFPTYDGPASGRAAEAVETAYAQLGDPYAWGAAGPGSFDCSGLTMFAWGAAGVSLPHSSSAQYNAVRRVSVNDLQPGDLVFYYSPISHVAMYIGGGRVIDAPYPGRSVHITGLHSMPLVGAGRP